MKQKGFSIVFVVLGILIILASIAFIYSKNTAKPAIQLPEQKVVDSKYKVTFRLGGYDKQSPPNFNGDLWIMNPDGTNKKKITSTGNIDKIHGWSPDNKKIAVTLEDHYNNNQFLKNTIAVVDVQSGKVTNLKEQTSYFTQIYWLNDQELVAVRGSNGQDGPGSIEKISAVDGKSQALLRFPNDISEIPESFTDSVTIKLSPDLQWMAFEKHPCCEGPRFKPILYVYNFKDKTKTKLLEEDHLMLQGWDKDKIVLTRNKHEIWEINSDGSGLNKILEDKDPVEHSIDPGYISRVEVSKDGTYLLYCRDVGWTQCYISHYTSGQKIMAVKQLFNDRPQNVSLSPDNSFIVYAQRSGTHDETREPVVCFTRIIREDYPTKTTTESCSYPSISN